MQGELLMVLVLGETAHIPIRSQIHDCSSVPLTASTSKMVIGMPLEPTKYKSQQKHGDSMESTPKQ